MLVLAIDPGITTGVAVLDSTGAVVSSYELSGDPEFVIDELEREAFTCAVIEQGPPGRNNPFLDDLDARLRATFTDACWMRPSEWKGSPRAQQSVDDVRSRHARDAARMGREYLHTLETAG